MVRAVFMGSDMFSLPVLHRLVEYGSSLSTPVDVVAVVAAPNRPGGRGRVLRRGPVVSFAGEHGIDILQPERIGAAESVDDFRALAPELVVVASYGQILPRAVLNEPRFGSLNLHPSLLPRYRGPSPIPASILAGDEMTGITLMLMSPRMDAGSILAQETAGIGADETAGELEARLADLSAGLLVRVLPSWLDGAIEPRVQNEDEATYTSLLKKSDGVVRWENDARDLARHVRALNPWPTAQTALDGRPVRLLRSHAVDGTGEPGRIVGFEEGSLTVGTGNGLLAVTELQLAGSRPVCADALLRGHSGLVGSSFNLER